MRDANLDVRVPIDLRTDLEALAVRQGRTLSDVVREACRTYADHNLAGTAGLFDRADLAGPNPLTYNGPGSARTNDPATAKDAASMVAPRIGSQRHQALLLIEANPRTTDDVIAAMQLAASRHGRRGPAVNGVARRVTDLYQAGAIEPLTRDGIVQTRPTRNNRDAIVWAITPAGRRWLAEVEDQAA